MQLLFPDFLFGLAAVSIPVIIHLLQLRRPQRLQFTNTEFIRQLALTTARQRRVEQWLLLLLRVAVVVFLVLAFCQPFIPARKQVASGTGSIAAVLVDTSPSMQVAAETNETILQNAVAHAQNLGALNAESQARFELLNDKGKLLTAKAYQAKLQDVAIDGHSLGLRGANAAGMLSRAKQKGPLYIFSDFQKNAVTTQLLSALGAANEQVILVTEAGKQAANVLVDSVWLDDAFVRVQTNASLHIRVRNGGQLDAKDCPVKVFLGPQQVAAFRVSVEAGQVATSVVQVQVGGRELALGRVMTEDAPVTFDNTYYFTLRPAAQISVLEIGPEPVAQRAYSNEPVFSYKFNSASAVDYGLVNRANLILVQAVPQVSAGLREALRGALRRGSSVVIVPPAEAKSQASYQQLFTHLGLGAARWQAVATPPELREVAMPPVGQPFFQDVFGAQQRQATMPRAAPVLRWDRTDEDILKFRDGDSYLAEFRTGPGRAYVFVAPFQATYSDFTGHALFVPVLYRLAMLSYRDDQLPAYRLTQPALTLTVPMLGSGSSQADEMPYQLVKDSLTLIPGQRTQGRELRLETPVGLTEPGFYQLRRNKQTITTLAFNQDKRESELAAYSAAELRQLLGTTHPNVHVLEGGVGNAVARYRAEQTGQPLWRYCLALALACLLAEELLLRWGRRARQTTTAGAASETARA